MAGFIAISIALILIFGIAGSLCLFVFLPWSKEDIPEWAAALFWIMSTAAGLGLWSYFAAIVADNRVPKEKENQPAYPSFCIKCHKSRPARAHHCSTCRECILRMDHHCPWINNCVGERNHGHYLRFLAYWLVAMLLGLVLMMARLNELYGEFGSIDRAVELAVLMADFVACAVLSLMIGVLAVVQFANVVMSGKTTIEGMAKEQEPGSGDNNQSWLINGKAVFGRYVLLWPLPLPLAWNPLLVVDDAHVTRLGVNVAEEGEKGTSHRPYHARFRQGSADDGGGFIVPSPNYAIRVGN